MTHRRHWLLCAIIALPLPASAKRASSKQSAASLLAQLNVLTTARPFAAEDVGRRFGATLAKSSDSTQYFTVYSGTGRTPFAQVEARIPTKESDKVDGMVLISIDMPECLSNSEVNAAFAGEAKYVPPPAHAPRSEASNYEIARTWGSIRAQFDHGCLRRFIVDAIRPSVGVATLGKDGTLTLQLRSSGGAEGLFKYERSDPKYADTVAHLGGIAPNESKRVPAWPVADKP